MLAKGVSGLRFDKAEVVEEHNSKPHKALNVR